MVFINSKLGNGHRINTADSSKDNEHYFSGAKKSIKLNLRPKFFSEEKVVSLPPNTGITGGVFGLTQTPDGKIVFCQSGRAISASLNFGADGTWFGVSGSGQGNFAALDVSENYLFTLANFTISGRSKVYRAPLSSSLGIDDFVEIYDDLIFGGFAGYDIQAVSDDVVLISGGNSQPTDDEWIVKRTVSGTLDSPTWETIDIHTGSAGNCIARKVMSASSEPTIIAAGERRRPEGGQVVWLTRVSTDGGATWNDVDEDSNYLRARAILVTDNGDVFVGGEDNGASGPGIIKKSSLSDLSSWSTVDSYGSIGGDGICSQIIYDEVEDAIYAAYRVAGSLAGNGGVASIRKSIDGGNTWFTFYNAPALDSEAGFPYAMSDDLKVISSGSQKFVGYGHGSGGAAWIQMIVKKLTKSNEILFSSSKEVAEHSGVFSFDAQFAAIVSDVNNNFVIEKEDQVSGFFPFSGSQFDQKFSFSDITFKLSSSADVPFSASTVNILFQDNKNFATPQSILSFGDYTHLGGEVYEFKGRLPISPEIAFLNENSIIQITSSFGIHKIWDFKLAFEQALSDDGVRKFKEIDNQNIDFEYINYGLMGNVEG